MSTNNEITVMNKTLSKKVFSMSAIKNIERNVQIGPKLWSRNEQYIMIFFEKRRKCRILNNQRNSLCNYAIISLCVALLNSKNMQDQKQETGLELLIDNTNLWVTSGNTNYTTLELGYLDGFRTGSFILDEKGTVKWRKNVRRISNKIMNKNVR